jgi:hypothetical protein
MVDKLKQLRWLEPWRPITEESHARALEAELAREVNDQHILYGTRATAVATGNCDDVLYLLASGPFQLAVVHLTWSGKTDLHDEFPSTDVYVDLDSFVRDRMMIDAWRLP